MEPGERIEEGFVLGAIANVYGDLVETLRAPAGADIALGVSTYRSTPNGVCLIELGVGLTEMKAPQRR